MKKSIGINSNILQLSLLLLRLGVGIMMLVNHGLPKLLNYNTMAPQFFDPLQVSGHFMLGVAVFLEVLCSILLIAGLFSRWAALLLAIEMLITIFVVHAGNSLGELELNLHYLVSYIVLFLLGPGRVSIDNGISRR